MSMYKRSLKIIVLVYKRFFHPHLDIYGVLELVQVDM